MPKILNRPKMKLTSRYIRTEQRTAETVIRSDALTAPSRLNTIRIIFVSEEPMRSQIFRTKGSMHIMQKSYQMMMEFNPCNFCQLNPFCKK